jgi:hypothetical protein
VPGPAPEPETELTASELLQPVSATNSGKRTELIDTTACFTRPEDKGSRFDVNSRMGISEK